MLGEPALPVVAHVELGRAHGGAVWQSGRPPAVSRGEGARGDALVSAGRRRRRIVRGGPGVLRRGRTRSGCPSPRAGRPRGRGRSGTVRVPVLRVRVPQFPRFPAPRPFATPPARRRACGLAPARLPARRGARPRVQSRPGGPAVARAAQGSAGAVGALLGLGAGAELAGRGGRSPIAYRSADLVCPVSPACRHSWRPSPQGPVSGDARIRSTSGSFARATGAREVTRWGARGGLARPREGRGRADRRVARLAAARRRDLRVTIIGDGPERTACERRWRTTAWGTSSAFAAAGRTREVARRCRRRTSWWRPAVGDVLRGHGRGSVLWACRCSPPAPGRCRSSWTRRAACSWRPATAALAGGLERMLDTARGHDRAAIAARAAERYGRAAGERRAVATTSTAAWPPDSFRTHAGAKTARGGVPVPARCPRWAATAGPPPPSTCAASGTRSPCSPPPRTGASPATAGRGGAHGRPERGRPLRALLRRPGLPQPAAAPPAADKPAPSPLTRVLVPDAFAVSWVPAALRAARGGSRASAVDCVVTSSPFESTHLVGLWLRARPARLARRLPRRLDLRAAAAAVPARRAAELDARLERPWHEAQTPWWAPPPPIADDLRAGASAWTPRTCPTAGTPTSRRRSAATPPPAATAGPRSRSSTPAAEQPGRPAPAARGPRRLRPRAGAGRAPRGDARRADQRSATRACVRRRTATR